MNIHEDEFIRSLGPGVYQWWLLDLRKQYHDAHINMRDHEIQAKHCAELRDLYMQRYKKVLEYAGYEPANANAPAATEVKP